MRRKQVIDRLKEIGEVRAALSAHSESVSRELDQRLTARKSTVSYRAYFDLMGQELGSVESKLIENEDRHVRQQVRIDKLRLRNQELRSELYTKQTSARRVLTGLYGTEHAFALVAAAGSTPRDARVLREQVDQTVKLLRHPENPLPEVRIAGVAVDFAALADDLETTLLALRAARTTFELLDKQADATRAATNEAIAESRRIISLVGTNLERAFRLVDKPDLAERIRSIKKRVSRQPDLSEEAPSEASEAAQQEEETAPSDGTVDTSPADDADAESAPGADPVMPAALASNDS